MVQQNCLEETTNSENPLLRREPTVRSEDSSKELHDEPGESQPTEPTDDAEAHADFWSIQEDFIYRHHTEPRVQLCAERRNIPYFTEIHSCYKIYFY